MQAVVEYLKIVYPKYNFERNLKNRSGDIFSGMMDFPFSIEVKNVEGWKYRDFINYHGRLRGPIESFWRQACRDCVLRNRTIGQAHPWLIFTRNYEPVFFMFALDVCREFPLLRPMKIAKKFTVSVTVVPDAKVFLFPSITPKKFREVICRPQDM